MSRNVKPIIAGMTVTAFAMVSLGIVLLVFAGYLFHNYYIPELAPLSHQTTHTSFFWGVMHGAFALPTYFYSLAIPDLAIYQVGGSAWYDLGYIIGLGGICITIGKSSVSVRR